MSKMKRLTLQKSWACAAALVAVLCLSAQPRVLAQDQPPAAQGTSRGENFSAKPPAALFASDCTGAGCHKGPQGLNKGQGLGGLAGFLREHYTNSRESAAALAGYLSKLPSGPEPKEARTPPSRQGKPAAVAPTSSSPGWAEGFGFPPLASPPKPAPNEARIPRDGQKPAAKPTRAAARPDTPVKPDEDPTTAPAGAAAPTMTPSAAPAAHQSPDAESTESDSKPAEPAAKPAEAPGKPPTRAQQRGRHPTAAAAAPQVPVPPAPPPAPAAEAAPAAAPPSPPQQFDIFD